MPVDEFGREIKPTTHPSERALSSARGPSHRPPPSNNARAGSEPHGQPPPPYHPERSFSHHHPSDFHKDHHHRLSSSPRHHPHKHQHQHVSFTYADEPLLCQVLWKTKNNSSKETTDATAMDGATVESAVTRKPEETTAVTTTTTADSDDETLLLYNNYKRHYCLRYIRAFFNHHLDDSWFRQAYSPLARVRQVQQEQRRAIQEAQNLQQQVTTLLSSSNATTIPATLDRVLSLSHGRKNVLAALELPAWHALSTTECSLVVQAVPAYCSDEQVLQAVAAQAASDLETANPTSAEEGAVTPVAYSSTPLSEHAYVRSVVLMYPSVDARVAAWKRLQSQSSHSSSKSSTSFLPAATTTTSVPRRSQQQPAAQHQLDTNTSSVVSITIDCTDPYGRREYDANGRGGPSADNAAVDTKSAPPSSSSSSGMIPRRTVQCLVSVLSTTAVSQQQPQRVSVLSAAVSSESRISSDYGAAQTLAGALDIRRHIPPAHRLEAILQQLLKKQVVDATNALLLDTCIAYLRRVHLVSFYHGCHVNLMSIRAETSPSMTVADVLLGVNKQVATAGTVYLRLEQADVMMALQQNTAVGSKRERETDAEEDETHVPADVDARDDDKTNDEPMASSASEPFQVAVVGDLLVQRLDESIAKALEVCSSWTQTAVTMISDQVDQDARDIERSEEAAVDRWIHDHSILDDDGRARCSFVFCHKLFKDSSFLNKHLMKKHVEFLKAEQAKCHDAYMMKAWDASEDRRVPDVLVDCGKQFGLVPSKVFGREPDCEDPEPRMWQQAQEKRQREEDLRQRRDLERQQYQQSRRHGMDGVGSSPPARASGFVDVDDMKEEKVEVSFDIIDVPVLDVAARKKKKKRKLL